MKQVIFSVYDLKACIYDRPFSAVNKDSAKRAFLDAAQNPEVTMSKHPEDYNLFALGEFNDGTGELKPYKNIEYIASANDAPKEKVTEITPV